jgi:hypothetical protein
MFREETSEVGEVGESQSEDDDQSNTGVNEGESNAGDDVESMADNHGQSNAGAADGESSEVDDCPSQVHPVDCHSSELSGKSEAVVNGQTDECPHPNTPVIDQMDEEDGEDDIGMDFKHVQSISNEASSSVVIPPLPCHYQYFPYPIASSSATSTVFSPYSGRQCRCQTIPFTTPPSNRTR